MSLNADTMTLPRRKGSESRNARHSIAATPVYVMQDVLPVKIDNLAIKSDRNTAVQDNVHSYDRYLHTLRFNRQRKSEKSDCCHDSTLTNKQEHNVSNITVHSTVV